jgi:hypothetical protein
MSPIHFQTVIGPEQVIRLPNGVNLPEGPVDVVVKTPEGATETGDRPQAVRDWLLGLAAESEQISPDLPADLAERHDHYAHGKPLS